MVFSAHTAAAFRLLILTGCRLREILHARWDGVDFERGVLQLADSKTGQRPVLLNAPALAVLDSLDRVGPFVVAGQPPKTASEPSKPRADLKRPWEALRSEAKLEGVRIHDLRHSFAATGAGSGLGLPIIGRLLGHTQAVTTQRYAHLADDPLRRATDTIGATIAAALDGKSDPETVVPMRATKPARGG
jgi:integrase